MSNVEKIVKINLLGAAERWHRYHPKVFPSALITDGIVFLLNEARLTAVIDIILSSQSHPEFKGKWKQQWIFQKNEDSSWSILWQNGMTQAVIHTGTYTDIPLDRVEMMLLRGANEHVVMLPNEL